MPSRTHAQRRQHYEIEKALANKLKNAPTEKRKYLYTKTYNELFKAIPDHPQLQATDTQNIRDRAQQKWQLVNRFVTNKSTILEIGAGDGSFSNLAASSVHHVYALEVSDILSHLKTQHKNITAIETDGTSIPLPQASIDFAYSNQVIEHLHPEDAVSQLQNIFTTIKPGGSYLCITPHRFSGPHDISQFFDAEATGLHLKEYTIAELIFLFKDVGFTSFKLYAGGLGSYLRFPLSLALLLETILFLLPSTIRRPLSRFLPIRAILGINLLAIK